VTIMGKTISEFTIHTGLSDKQKRQLIAFTKYDTASHKNTSDWITSDGHMGRFSSLEKLNEWLLKGRTIYTLNDNNNNLLGIIWFGQKELSKEFKLGITFAIRTYPIPGDLFTGADSLPAILSGIKIGARGKGIAYPFMINAFYKYVNGNDYKKIRNKRIWLEVEKGNIPAVSLYKKFGFEQVIINKSEGVGKILMMLPYTGETLKSYLEDKLSYVSLFPQINVFIKREG